MCFVFFFPNFFCFMAPFFVFGLVECDGNGFLAFDISCMKSWVLLNASLSTGGGGGKSIFVGMKGGGRVGVVGTKKNLWGESA